jgi:uncharacterized cupin superfamily protein
MGKIIIENLTSEEITKRGILQWPIWEKGISKFDWYYEADEECLILEGEVIIETSEEILTIVAGNFVTFPKGLNCVWDVKRAIRKHYCFK